MRCVVITRHGRPADVATPAERPRPRPGPGEVLVRLRARPVNPSDELFIEGRYGRRPTLPAVPGFEGAGVVAASDSAEHPVGQRVAVAAAGTWQEYVAVPAADVVPVPDRLPDAVACQLTVNPLTALLLVRELALRGGDWLLITAAGAALSRMVLHLARRDGVRCACVVRDGRHADRLTLAGADVVVDSAAADLVERVRAATGGAGVHAVLDAVGGEVGSAALRCLRDGGQAVVLGMLDGGPVHVTPHRLVFDEVAVRGFWLPRHLARQPAAVRAELVERAVALLGVPAFAPRVAAAYDLADVREALDHVRRAGRAGKVILTG
ncbi:zinc-dependent alcohol dehydrogenase family protein [Saccharothrix australiensis]|uniref:NADPH:quinone reductase-like Zn-dependent oxidoreductase n=1 Tax=Saccharothrix australiensis TaxID=2072 RepID=A0A495VTX1_9PSEU|nr:zinc-dependent alcohol dehydrogenase family protein [Saccharothrix australiensis]RKT52816.1 NADPH:quinone reductase-like Zn-dependent oxidoreductase [Saccharothrix australiensis]